MNENESIQESQRGETGPAACERDSQQVHPKPPSNQVELIHVGSRRSKLALIQTNHVISRLESIYNDNQHKTDGTESLLPPLEYKFPIREVVTTGDHILDTPLSQIGSKSLFTKELEDILLDGQIKFVVHSLKDLATTLPAKCVIGAILQREIPHDCLVLSHKSAEKYSNAMDILRENEATSGDDKVTIGTSSQRRIAQLRRINPELNLRDIRGNLNTRLAKLDDPNGPYDALVLAAAGLTRAGFGDRISAPLTRRAQGLEWYYAVGQGALAVECRDDDNETLALLQPLVHLPTVYTTIAERNLMRRLEGGCSVPIGVTAEWLSGGIDSSCPFMPTPPAQTIIDHLSSCVLQLTGTVISLDGKRSVVATLAWDLNAPETDALQETNGGSGDCVDLLSSVHPSATYHSTDSEEQKKLSMRRARNAGRLGIALAQELVSRGASNILQEIRSK